MIPAGVDVYVSLEPVNLRLSFDRLAGLVSERMGRSARSSAVFVFFNRRRTMLKALFFDGTGLCIFHKRMDKGRFQMPDPIDDAQGQAVVELNERELDELLDGIYLLRECTRRTRDAIISMGERASAPILSAAFRAAGSDAVALDATAFIRTDSTFGEANVQFEETNTMVQWRFQNIPDEQIAVVTGFIAATERGVTTTLGRSGSDELPDLELDLEEAEEW